MTGYIVLLAVLLALTEVNGFGGGLDYGQHKTKEKDGRHDDGKAPFDIPDKAVKHEAGKVPNSEEKREDEKPQAQNLNLLCISTGPGCIDNCNGIKAGHYQRCNNCNGYAYCTNGHAYIPMPCPVGLVWDNHRKFCHYSHQVHTCLSCLPGGTTYNFLVDLRKNILGVGDHRYFQWSKKPAQMMDVDCRNRGTLVLKKPECAKSLRLYLNFNDNKDEVRGYSFHVTSAMLSNGWGGIDQSGNFFDGQEIHSYDNKIYAFKMAADSGSELVNSEDITSDVLINVDHYVHIRNFRSAHGKRSTSASDGRLDVFLLGFNEVANFPERYGRGLCRAWISWIC